MTILKVKDVVLHMAGNASVNSIMSFVVTAGVVVVAVVKEPT